MIVVCGVMGIKEEGLHNKEIYYWSAHPSMALYQPLWWDGGFLDTGNMECLFLEYMWTSQAQSMGGFKGKLL